MTQYMNPNERIKTNAALAVTKAIRDGVIVRDACEICGALGMEITANGQRRSLVHAHHDDYNYPLRVRWLCKSHHHEWHGLNRASDANPELIGLSPAALYELDKKQLRDRIKDEKDNG